LASRSLGELSPHVRWWGWQDAPLEFVRRADAFFLSSVDDPLPLGCLEAMMLGKRCVVYRQTGVAELIDQVGGCAVFEEYSANAAFGALERSLAEPPDSARLARITREKTSLAAFADSLQRLAVPPQPS